MTRRDPITEHAYRVRHDERRERLWRIAGIVFVVGGSILTALLLYGAVILLLTFGASE